jgi:hypothetical protein
MEEIEILFKILIGICRRSHYADWIFTALEKAQFQVYKNMIIDSLVPLCPRNIFTSLADAALPTRDLLNKVTYVGP